MEMNMVTRASLGQELLKDLPLFIPPIEEQCELAAYLVIESKKIESAMALKRSQINALKEYKTSLINEAVTGKIKVA
jgi:type I restriction enzyme S subunit